MPIFSKKADTTSPQPMTMAQFIARAKGMPEFGPYNTKFGNRHADLNLQALYDRNLRMLNPAGVWSNAGAPDYNRVAVGNQLLKVTPGDLGTFDMFLGEQMRQDVTKTTGRETYLQNLKADALAGRLYTRLQAATETEANYYTAPVPRAPAPGAPPIPAKPARMVNKTKAMAWVTRGVGGSDAQTTFAQAFNAYSKPGGPFFITGIDVLNAIWRKVVTGAPHYRPVNIVQPTKYPSSLAGSFILKDVIADFSTTPKPPQGDNRWYDWALYFFASVMTSQAFTDGNKRVSRMTYAIILVDGGVNFLAPTDTLGSQLGDM